MVCVHALVSVEMIGSQVGQHADVGTEAIYTGELEGTHFHHVPGRGGTAQNQLARSWAQ